ETEAGCGILEEPELTLLSSGDVSAAESDAEHSSRAKMKEDKINHPAHVAQAEPNAFPEEPGFLPLAPDADCSAFLRPGEGPSKAQYPDGGRLPSRQTAVMLLEFTAPPRGLRESFLKRKKNFIQKSVRRVEEMKNRERGKEKLEARQSQRREAEKSSRQKEPRLASGRRGVVASGLKKVGEVKVSSPDSRKPGEAAANQQTSRQPDQLAEGRIRKEETTRQETYAKNREKAKEFEKKMLEKLRAKKTWK
ncbi:CE295 protein, partial [Upupa epops]|nr:CE295 protein [Upupa epops]